MEPSSVRLLSPRENVKFAKRRDLLAIIVSSPTTQFSFVGSVEFAFPTVKACFSVRRSDRVGPARLPRVPPSRNSPRRGRFRTIGRCLRLVLLYDGIVTPEPACQIAGEGPAQRSQVSKSMF